MKKLLSIAALILAFTPVAQAQNTPEALAGHPLYQRGLSGYGVFEVINSSWSKQLTEQNRVSS